jgi:hypothetical protein
MAASTILGMDVAHDSPSALELSWRHPCGLAFLDYKIKSIDGVELYGEDVAGTPWCSGTSLTAFAEARPLA